MLPRAVSDYYRAQQRLIVATLGLVRLEWRKMGDDLDASWARVGPRVALLTASAQVGSATNGAAYVPATLDQLGQSVKAAGGIVPQSLVGAQSIDGLTYGSLDALLYGAVVKARMAPTESLAERLAVGGRHLDLLVHTQVSDAGKQAASVAMTTRPRVGYVRVVNPPCCKRCAVLAGKYSAPEAFPRHPRCDCMAMPVADGKSVPGQEVSPDQIKDLTVAERAALDEGADLSQVVNATRGRSKDGMTTSEGTTRRGLASKRIRELNAAAKETSTDVGKRGYVKNYVERRVQRLTPEGIYRVSATREEAIQRLRDNGYIR